MGKTLYSALMTPHLKSKIIEVCDDKIALKGAGVSLSFYAFVKNKNEDPVLSMEMATWWISEQKLDQFEKAFKIRELVFDQ